MEFRRVVFRSPRRPEAVRGLFVDDGAPDRRANNPRTASGRRGDLRAARHHRLLRRPNPAQPRLPSPLAPRNLAVSPQLELRNVTKRFGGGAAAAGGSFEGANGEIIGIIGPNGAAKTTLLNCISA